MSESISLTIMAAAAAIVTYVWLHYLWAQRELSRLREYEFFADKYFKASEALINEPDTPPGLLAVIETLNKIMHEPRLARRFFEIYGRFAHERIEGKRMRQPDAELVAFTRKHPNLEPIVSDVMMGGILALTFLAGRRGTKHRAMLADLCGRERKPTIVIDAINETKHQHHGGLPAAA